MRILELFSCSGGLAEGFRRAGAPVAMAFDHDADACDSYEANHGHRPVQIDARDLLRMVCDGWRTEADLLVADPPCTPWSRAGKRLGVEDERDMLSTTIEIIRRLRPAAYLIANVPGLDDAPNLPIVQRILSDLSREGYCVRDFARLDAADYGVPQHRVRPFWYGHRVGRCVTWPSRTHGDVGECTGLPGMRLRPWVTCREALAHLSTEEMGRPIRLAWKSNCHPPSTIDEPAHVVPISQPGNGGAVLAFTGPNHRPSREDAPARTLTTNTHSDGALLLHERHPVSTAEAPSRTITTRGVSSSATTLTWPWERPATTVDTKERSHPNAIKLSERAAAVLQGFPEGWRFCGKTKASRWSQLGMAVPPGLAEPVARAILEAFADRTLARTA